MAEKYKDCIEDYKIDKNDKSNLTKYQISKFLIRKVMCGYCNFVCCAKNFYRPFPNLENGNCSKLTKNGCELGGIFSGSEKSNLCKISPIMINDKNKLIVTNWFLLHCPKPKDYILEKKENGKYIYKCIKNHYNKRKELILDFDIDNFPIIFELLKPQIVDVFGEEFYNVFREKIKVEYESGLSLDKSDRNIQQYLF